MFALPVTLSAFVLILVLARFRVPLGAAVSLGSVVMGLAFGLDANGLVQSAWTGATNSQALTLVTATVLLLGLSVLMRESGQLDEIVSLAHALLRRPAATMMAMPALIGLLPMPGGAIFSAPMVEAAGGKSGLSHGLLSYINYWFRHIWEYFWPLYPGVILAITLTNLDIPSWTALMVFGTVSMTLGGLLMMRKTNGQLEVERAAPSRGVKRKLLRATGSIWMILLIWAAGHFSATFCSGIIPDAVLRQGPLVLGLLGSILFTVITRKLNLSHLRKAFSQPVTYSTAGLVLSIMIFQSILQAIRAPQQIAGELQNLHVPIACVVAILPFIAGFVTGIAVGFVGTALPIVLNLVGAADAAGPVLAYIPLAYAFGHLGQMLSPLHVCQIVSNRYFGTTYGPVYRYLVPSSLLTAALNISYFLLLISLLK
ncbi:MAG: DUF401 family protein [Acidobacteria bacterium]|nr:DUF401 family protein [Acidobacteriota bacterium]